VFEKHVAHYQISRRALAHASKGNRTLEKRVPADTTFVSPTTVERATMRIDSAGNHAVHATQANSCPPHISEAANREDSDLREAFQSFVGQTLFGQMLQAMRKTVGKPAYFHGGRTEEIFQQQLDQVLAEKIADASSERLSDPMYSLFIAKRR
jgi:hypothetical protein